MILDRNRICRRTQHRQDRERAGNAPDDANERNLDSVDFTSYLWCSKCQEDNTSLLIFKLLARRITIFQRCKWTRGGRTYSVTMAGALRRLSTKFYMNQRRDQTLVTITVPFPQPETVGRRLARFSKHNANSEHLKRHVASNSGNFSNLHSCVDSLLLIKKSCCVDVQCIMENLHCVRYTMCTIIYIQ